MGPELKRLVTSPVGFAEISPIDARAEGTNPVCGDKLAFGAQLAQGRLSRLVFQATACPACLAVASCAVEVYEGQQAPKGPPFTLLRSEVERLGGLSNFEGHALKLVEAVLSEVLDAASSSEGSG